MIHLTTSKRLLFVILVVFICSLSFSNEGAMAASTKTYTIKATSTPYKKQFMNYSTYNKYTKHYYVFRSYLERLEKLGGGKIVVKKGTYTITNTLYVPSNVKIEFENGVTIKKGKKTGTKKITPAKSIFQLIKPSKANKSGVYGKYNGEKNISFIGRGKVVFDLAYDKDSIAIIMGHNSNIYVTKIDFRNMYSGHFIEMDASQNVVIENCSFKNHKSSLKRNKEAINLDTPDRLTKGWSQKWSKFDKTANRNVTIEKNQFYNLERAIGTHKYTENKYHTNIQVINNDINKMVQDGIRVMNWERPIIKDNYIRNIPSTRNEKYRGILMSGVIYPEIRGNKIENMMRPIGIMPWKNSGDGSQYEVTNNLLSEENKRVMSETTYIRNVNEEFVRINYTYNVFDSDTEKLMVQKF